MSKTTFPINDPLSNKLWAKKLTVEGLKATYFGKFMGTGSSAMIHVKTEPSKGAGDEVTFGLRMQLISTTSPASIPPAVPRSPSRTSARRRR